jgi:hypothetical protein
MLFFQISEHSPRGLGSYKVKVSKENSAEITEDLAEVNVEASCCGAIDHAVVPGE